MLQSSLSSENDTRNPPKTAKIFQNFARGHIWSIYHSICVWYVLSKWALNYDVWLWYGGNDGGFRGVYKPHLMSTYWPLLYKFIPVIWETNYELSQSKWQAIDQRWGLVNDMMRFSAINSHQQRIEDCNFVDTYT